MSADPITVDSANGGDPVDHHRPEGREITRRTLLKTGAAAGAAMGMGAIPSQSVSATTAPSLVATPIISPGFLAVSAIGSAIDGVFGSTPDTGDRLTLHQQATQQKEGWDGHVVQFNNRLTDASTIADIEARDGIAQSYENGATENEALSNALARIRSYYADAPEHNAIEIANKALLSYRVIQHAGDQTDPVFTVPTAWQNEDDTVTGQIVFRPDGTADLSKDDPGLTSSTITRHDGTEHTVGVGVQNADDNPLDEPMTPILEIYDDSYYADGASKVDEIVPLSDETIDAYDSSADEFVFTLSDNSVIHTNLKFTIPPITDSDGNQLRESKTVFDLRELMKILTEIQDQSDTIVGNYDANFVGELYALMDDGTIDPGDIRGSAGIARFLSGTDDASDSRFQLALMQQLGMSRSDLSNVASMSVTLQGATDSKVEYTDSGDRNVIPTDFESLELEGQLFARTDVSEIASGEVYFPRERVYGVGADSSIYAIDPSDGSEIWASDHSFSNGMAIAESVKGDKVFVADNNGGNVDCHDATSGSIEWTGSVSGPCESIAVDPADEAVYIGTNDGVLDAIDPADGSGLWSENIGGEIAALSAQHDGDWLIVASGSAIRRVSTADGSVDWEYTEASSALVDIDLLGDGSEAIATDGSTFHIVDTADGTQKRTFSDPNNSARTSAGPDGEAVYSVNGNTSDVYAINTSDGSTRWTNSSHTYEPEVVTVTPSGSEIVTASYDEIVAFDSTGSRSWSTSSMNVQYKVASGPSIPGKPGGKLSNALFFDVANGEEYELQSGSITIEEITDADGNELDSSDYNEPGYDTYDSQEYAEYVEEHTTYKETIYREEDSGPSVPCLIGCGDDGGDWIGLVVIGAILFMVVGWVTDLLPFVGGD